MVKSNAAVVVNESEELNNEHDKNQIIKDYEVLSEKTDEVLKKIKTRKIKAVKK